MKKTIKIECLSEKCSKNHTDDNGQQPLTEIEDIAIAIFAFASQCEAEPMNRMFQKLEAVIGNSEHPLAEGRRFLQAFVEQINLHTGSTLTLVDACKLMKDTFQSASPEHFDLILKAIRYIEEGEKIVESPALMIYHYSLLKTEQKREKQNKEGWPGLVPFVLGLIEAGAGALVLPANPVVGGILIADGASRVVQGIQDNIEGNAINIPF